MVANANDDMRARVLEIFSIIPLIDLDCGNAEDFTFPSMTSKQQTLIADAPVDYSRARYDNDAANSGPVERLRSGMEKAAQKLRYGETSNDTWRDLLLFSDDRLSRKKPFHKVTSNLKFWTEGTVINRTSESFEDWFTHHLLERISEGGGERHSQAITGSPGSGKSTLVKYAISYYSSNIDYLGIVFTRFEFLKFLADWHEYGNELALSLENYLSFIRSRDLIISHFMVFRNGDSLVLKDKYRDAQHLQREILDVAAEMHYKSQSFGRFKTEEYCLKIIEEAVRRVKKGNNYLIKWLRRLEKEDRILIEFALWGEKTVVTIFDGLDSLNVEDAFQETPEWSAVEEIVQKRSVLCKPAIFTEKGISVKADSIIISRKNTLALLKLKLRERGLRFGINRVYEVQNVDGATAIVSVVSRSCMYIDDVRESSTCKQKSFVRNVSILVQRTLVAISRGHGARVPSNLVYGVFDGNLRELFRFVARVIFHSLNDMLSMKLIEGRSLFGSTLALADHAVKAGNVYLERKSYQIIEMFLYDGPRYENALKFVTNLSKEFPSPQGAFDIQKNRDFYGHVDNLYSYHYRGPADGLDQHPLLEKIRVLQCLRERSMTDRDLLSALKDEFGYEPAEFRTLLLLLIKGDLISVNIVQLDDDYDYQYCATPRALLSLVSLIENLAYLENIFHRSRLPSSLVAHISDNPRAEISSESWAARAINNSFIFLCYLRKVEKNRSGGVTTPEEYELFGKIHSGVVRSIRRMLRIRLLEARQGDYHDLVVHNEDDNKERVAKRIAAEAHRRLSETYHSWKRVGVTPDSQKISVLEIDRV